MPFISYAQNLEDVMLWRALKHIEKGFYIDVGAWSPNLESVTRAFYEHGWRGINVEPNSEFHDQLQAHRTRDINLRIALSDRPGTFVMNFLSNPGLSTLDEAIAQRHAHTGLTIDKQEVEVTNLATLWKQHVPEGQDVHFLKVDVEGLEEAVLRGNDWSKCRPWILVVEATFPMSQQQSHDAWEPILLAANYCFVYADGLNRFYIANEHAELHPAFKYPPNVFDEFKLDAQYCAELRAQQVLSEASLAIKVESERAKCLESEWDASKNRVGKLTEELAEAHNRAIQLEAQLEDRSHETNSATQALTIENERNKWLEDQWNTTKKRLDELVGEIAITRDRSLRLEVQLTERSHSIDSLTKALKQEREQTKWLENEWNAAKIKIDELKANSHYWWTMADNFNQEYQAMKASVCWRITSPLRVAFDALLWIRAILAHISHEIMNRIRIMLSSLLESAIRFTLSHSALKTEALSLLRRCPAIEAWFREFAAAKGMIPGGTITPISSISNESIEFLDLTPSARHVFIELKAAIERNNKRLS